MRRLHLVLFLLLAACANPAKLIPVEGPYPMLISGTRIPGSDTTEPDPEQSRFFRTENGGVVILPQGAGLYLQVAVIEKPAAPLYIVIEYEDPRDPKTPLVNDQVFAPDLDALRFSVPRPQTGLKPYATYPVRVRVFESASSKTPIDTLVQPIRSYVDTTGGRPYIHSNVVVAPNPAAQTNTR